MIFTSSSRLTRWQHHYAVEHNATTLARHAASATEKQGMIILTFKLYIL
ncbi:MAG: hypothetical protein IJR13_01830 [Bacteroidales bacterium]|nr:hypothetical protein [Bacteroidales bacterium]